MGPVCYVAVKPKLISEESRFIGLSCHNFVRKISLFSSGLKKKKNIVPKWFLCFSFFFFFKECKPNGAKR